MLPVQCLAPEYLCPEEDFKNIFYVRAAPQAGLLNRHTHTHTHACMHAQPLEHPLNFSKWLLLWLKMPEFWYTTFGGTNCIAASEKKRAFLGEQDSVSYTPATHLRARWLPGLLLMAKAPRTQVPYQIGEFEGQMPTGLSCFKKGAGSLACLVGWGKIRLCFACCVTFLRLCWLCCPFYMSRSAVCFLHCCKKHAQCKCRPLCRLCPVSLHEIVIKTPFLRLHPFGSKLWAALWQCDIPKQWTVETETTAARCTWSSKVGRCNFKPEHLQVIRSMERALCLTHMSEVWIMVFSLRASVRIGD